MNRKLRVGVIGAGNILWQHVGGYKQAGDLCEVVAIAKRNADEATRTKLNELFGHEMPVYADYKELLARDDIDAVDILTPHDLHMPMTIAAARSGKHVLVEKPMARNVYECDRMIEACEAAGVSLYVCHDRRYGREWAAIKEIVDSGVLGEIFYLKLEHNHDVDLPQGHWIRSYDQLGGGAVISCLCHQIDGLRWFGGEVETVASMTKTLPARMEGETVGELLMTMKNGALANVSINWFTPASVSGGGLWCELVHICGDRGEVYYKDGPLYCKLHGGAEFSMSGAYNLLPADGGFTKIEPKDRHGGVSRCVLEWIKALRGEGGLMVTPGRDARKTVEVAEAAYLSEKSRRFVTLPIEPVAWGS